MCIRDSVGSGPRATVLDTTSASPAARPAGSKIAQVAAIRVTSELARSEDPFVRCAGCGVGKGRGAPVHARTPQNQLSEKDIYDLEDFFSCFCQMEPKALFLR